MITRYLAQANDPEQLAKLFERLTGKLMSPEGLQRLRDLIREAAPAKGGPDGS